MQNVLVVSHERSRTHFLINAIADNFLEVSGKDVISVPATNDINIIDNFIKNVEVNKGLIFKDHHQFEFYRDNKLLSKLSDRFKIIYIAREGKDVITSMYYYFNAINFPQFPFSKSPVDLMRKDPTNYEFDNAYSFIKSHNFVERWARHVTSWMCYSNLLFMDSFDLYTNFNKTIARIANYINYYDEYGGPDFTTSYKRPNIKKSFSVCPRTGTIGDWIDFFNITDLRYFYNEVNKVNNGLYPFVFTKDRIICKYNRKEE